MRGWRFPLVRAVFAGRSTSRDRGAQRVGRLGGTAAGHDAWGLARAICVELAGEGLLDPDRLDEYVIPIYERTVEEVRRPFSEGIGERLELQEVRIAPVENPSALAYREDGDAARFARGFTAFFRAFSEPSPSLAARPVLRPP